MSRTTVRIAGVNLPVRKHVWIGLTSIFGIGRSRALKICAAAGVNQDKKLADITQEEEESLRREVDGYDVEGQLRRDIAARIKALMDKRCYRGLRHRQGLPVHGQRTHTNARTSKRRGGYRIKAAKSK